MYANELLQDVRIDILVLILSQTVHMMQIDLTVHSILLISMGFSFNAAIFPTLCSHTGQLKANLLRY